MYKFFWLFKESLAFKRFIIPLLSPKPRLLWGGGVRGLWVNSASLRAFHSDCSWGPQTGHMSRTHSHIGELSAIPMLFPFLKFKETFIILLSLQVFAVEMITLSSCSHIFLANIPFSHNLLYSSLTAESWDHPVQHHPATRVTVLCLSTGVDGWCRPWVTSQVVC